jgi:Fe-S-cluster containining protein
MYEFYRQPLTETIKQRTRKALKNLYSDIPETDGCMENIAKENGCGAWCCESQNPQLMYAEFLSTWNHVINSWGKERVVNLILRAIQTYLDGKITKGCIFWDKETKLCEQHQTRPFNCRTYAQVPEEDFKPRYEALKILYSDSPDVDLRPQCSLVKSRRQPTSEQMNEWFRELSIIEIECGIAPHLLNDKPGGSYRTYHDHILLYLSSDSFLMRITNLRSKGSEEEKKEFFNSLHTRLNDITDLSRIQL